MAIIKVAKGGKSLIQAIKYIAKENDFIGKDVSDDVDRALEEMQLTKEIYNKADGRQYKHYIVSFKPDEVNKEKAKLIAMEFAEKNFKGFEVAIGTHASKSHIHCHLIVNSINFETGRKFNVPKSFLAGLKKSNDEICKSHGLEIVKKGTEKELSGEIRAYDMPKYQSLKLAFESVKKSYVLDTAVAVKNAISISSNKDEFIKNMERQGYETSWIDSRKHITFSNASGNKVRLANLEKTFSDGAFTKEGLNSEFERNTERRKELDGQRAVTGIEQAIESRVGEQSFERMLDGVYNTIREIEKGTRKYGGASGEAVGRYGGASGEAVGRKQRDSEGYDKEQRITRKIPKQKTRDVDYGISL